VGDADASLIEVEEEWCSHSQDLSSSSQSKQIREF
jgi:hypothetical protein